MTADDQRSSPTVLALTTTVNEPSHRRSRVLAMFAAALLPLGTLLGVATPASAATHEVSTVEQLADAFSNADDGDTVVVTGDILGDAASPDVEVPVGRSLTLDLNGHSVTLVGSSEAKTGEVDGAGIWVPSTSSFTVIGTGGGTLDVRGGENAAGIGAKFLPDHPERAAGNITIHGGTIIATGGSSGAAIGGARNGGGGTVLITGGTVIAENEGQGAGIGAGPNGRDATVHITGGAITASSTLRAGIGSDGQATITIANATVEASGGSQGAGIGTGFSATGDVNIQIDSGTVTARGGNSGAGIGGGRYSSLTNLTINGGTVHATGGSGAAGIGGGSGDGSPAGNGGTVTINGGTVTAVAGPEAAAIGGGKAGSDRVAGAGADVTIAEGASVTVVGWGLQSAFGAGSGTLNADNFGSFTNAGELMISKDTYFTVPRGVNITNSGVIRNGGTLRTTGTMSNLGTIINNGTLANFPNISGYNTHVVLDSAGGSLAGDYRVFAPSFEASERVIRTSVRNGYDFIGWQTPDGEEFTETTLLPSNGPSYLRLTAQWEEVTYHSVTFNTRGGSSIPALQVRSGDAVAEPTAPERAGYTFLGWFNNSDLLPPQYDWSTPVTSDIILHAGWTENPVATELDLEADSTTVNESETVTLSAMTMDQFGDEMDDVTDDVVFTSDHDADVIDGNKVTFPTAGDRVITATHTDTGMTATIAITVNPRVVTVLALQADASTVNVREAVTITATGTDQLGDDLGDVTDEVVFSSSQSTDVVNGNQVTFQTTGDRTITATHSATGTTATIAITVNPRVVTELTLEADSTTVDQGGTITITALGIDQVGDDFGDVTDDIVLTSSHDTDVINGNMVTFTTASEHVITATHTETGATATITITVNPAPAPSAPTPSAPTPPKRVDTSATGLGAFCSAVWSRSA